MKNYSLKVLLKEGIINQTQFVEGLVLAIKENPNLVQTSSVLYDKLIESFEDAKISIDGDMSNKKIRKKVEIIVQRAMRTMPSKEKIRGGIDDYSGIELKSLVPLYDVMLSFLTRKKDVNLDDCIYAADYYMKKLYKSTSEEEKRLIQGGKILFDHVFNRSKYYFKYGEDIVSEDDFLTLYDDGNLSVVYPRSPGAFRYYLSSLEGFEGGFTYCTLKANHWYTHNRKFIVAILVNKSREQSHPFSVVSLKLNYDDGSVLAKETCDRNNEHINVNKLEEIISEGIQKEVADKVAEEREKFFMMPKISIYEVEEMCHSFVGIGKLYELSNLVVRNFGGPNYLKIVRTLYIQVEYDVYLEVMAEAIAAIDMLIYEEYYATDQESEAATRKIYKYFDFIYKREGEDVNIFLKDLYEAIYKKSLDALSHPRYFVSITSHIISGRLSIDFAKRPDYLEAARIAFNTNNDFTFTKLFIDVINLTLGSDINIEKQVMSIIASSKCFEDVIDKEIRQISGKINFNDREKFFNLLYDQSIEMNNEVLNPVKCVDKLIANYQSSIGSFPRFIDILGINQTNEPDVIYYLDQGLLKLDNSSQSHKFFILKSIAEGMYDKGIDEKSLKYFEDLVLVYGTISRSNKLYEVLSFLKIAYGRIENANENVVTKVLNSIGVDYHNIFNEDKTFKPRRDEFNIGKESVALKNKTIEQARKEFADNCIAAFDIANYNIFDSFSFLKQKYLSSKPINLEEIPKLKEKFSESLQNHIATSSKLLYKFIIAECARGIYRIDELLLEIGQENAVNIFKENKKTVTYLGSSINHITKIALDINFEKLLEEIVLLVNNDNVSECSVLLCSIFESKCENIPYKESVFASVLEKLYEEIFPHKILLRIISKMSFSRASKDIVKSVIKELPNKYEEDYKEFYEENKQKIDDYLSGSNTPSSLLRRKLKL